VIVVAAATGVLDAALPCDAVCCLVKARILHLLAGFDVERELARVFGDGVRPLHFEEALFEAILAGWVRQQRARMLAPSTIGSREKLVRRLQVHAGAWPWEWRAEHLEEWTEDLAMPPSPLHVSTLRQYQIAIRLFCEYVCDLRYPWVAICTERLGRQPQQIVDERNLIVHVAEFEAHPGCRPLSRQELQAFFDHCDTRVSGRRALKRKGSLAALRDAALFKTMYGGGCAAWSARSWMWSISRATCGPRGSGRSGR
jgi:integrase/recombinase XerC